MTENVNGKGGRNVAAALAKDIAYVAEFGILRKGNLNGWLCWRVREYPQSTENPKT